MTEQATAAMTNQPQQVQLVYAMPAQQADDEIDLGQLWDAIWAGKWWIIGISLLAALLAAAIAIKMPNIYRAKVVLAPSEESQSGGLAAMAGQLGGLASLAGINVGGGAVDKAAYAQEVMKSRAFIVDFIKRHDLLVPLMAAKGWDREQNQLIIDSDSYDVTAGRWVRDVKPPQLPQPSDWEAYEAFLELLAVSQDKQSGMISVTLDHYSPELAAQWATMLVQDINNSIRHQDVTEAQSSIDYLTAQLQKTSVADMQKVFFQLIEQQTKTIMLADVRPEYVFKTVDPAVAPEKKEKPKRALMVVLATILGGMLATLMVLVRSIKTKPKQV